MIFNTFNREKQTVEITTETPYMCQSYIEKKNKKCFNFYKDVCENEKEQGVFVCPYGLCAVKTPNGIYTCLNIVDKADMTKLVPNLKRSKQNPKQFTQYSLSQVIKLVDSFEKVNHETQVRRATIHDIKNATKHFMDLVEEVKSDEDVIKIAEANNKLLSSVEGYSLIQYRLAYHDKLLNYEDNYVEIAYINFHQAIKKLSMILMYRGVKKGVLIQPHGSFKRSFLANKDLYLMYFILIENALKFAIENTNVKINFSVTENDELKIEISNVCYHIDDDEIDNVFVSGFRGATAVKTCQGSGLGLSLAKKIADASNVQLRCRYDSIMEGNGRFVVECVHKRSDIDLKDEEG